MFPSLALLLAEVPLGLVRLEHEIPIRWQDKFLGRYAYRELKPVVSRQLLSGYSVMMKQEGVCHLTVHGQE